MPRKTAPQKPTETLEQYQRRLDHNAQKAREKKTKRRKEREEADRRRAEESVKRLDRLHRRKKRGAKMSTNDKQPTLSSVLAKKIEKGERINLSKDEMALVKSVTTAESTSRTAKANSIAAEAEHQKMKAQRDLFMEKRGLYNDVMGSPNPQHALRTLRQIQTLSASKRPSSKNISFHDDKVKLAPMKRTKANESDVDDDDDKSSPQSEDVDDDDDELSSESENVDDSDDDPGDKQEMFSPPPKKVDFRYKQSKRQEPIKVKTDKKNEDTSESETSLPLDKPIAKSTKSPVAGMKDNKISDVKKKSTSGKKIAYTDYDDDEENQRANNACATRAKSKKTASGSGTQSSILNATPSKKAIGAHSPSSKPPGKGKVTKAMKEVWKASAKKKMMMSK